MKKICIITPGTIASNPRVVKEAEALSEAGYKIHLIYTRHVDYLINTDQEILDGHPYWTSDYLDWAGPGLIPWALKYLSGIKRKASAFLIRNFPYSLKIVPFLINRFYFWQLNKAVSCKADLYIAHYPDSIPIAALAAKKNKALFAFDAEDYHRGEDISIEMITAISIIEDKFLPSAAYISAASPLISKAYQSLFPKVKAIHVGNMFPLKRQQSFVTLNDNRFKFLWFSQTIGPNRGLEEFIIILKHTGKTNIELTLLGNCSADFKTKLQKQWICSGLKAGLLHFVMTVPEKDIFAIAATHHFGLGLEIPYSLSRDICLTNKVYTYILSGNLLILSNTRAQKIFFDTYSETGICLELSKPEEAAAQVLKLMKDPLDLNIKRRQNHELGRTILNFDREKQILLKQVRKSFE